MAEDDIARFVNVVIEMKKEIFQRYDDPACTPDAELMNVWPQPSSPWNAAVKSPREWVTCRVCKGNITLEDAQNQIKTNLASAVQKEVW